MRSGMQQRPLLISSLIEHAAAISGDVEIISRPAENGGKGPLHRYDFRAARSRSKRLANALVRLGIGPGDRVGTLAWNTHRHFELYYGVSGMGAIIHTLNPRLFPEQITYIANHAEDCCIFFDVTFAPLVEKIAPLLGAARIFVALTGRKDLPVIPGVDVLCYEDLLAVESDEFEWPLLDEQAPSSLCYTSGTTGNPKGVLYSHRSTLLHTYAAMSAEAFCLNARDVVLPVVPMFHVNAWSLPYLCAAAGVKLVLPGPALDGASLFELMEGEQVTVSAGVPTIWLGLLNYVKSNALRFSSLRETVIGGSACPSAMIRTFEDDYGVDVIHAWGMTELSPLGSICRLKAKHAGLNHEGKLAVKAKQGRPIFGVEMKIVDAAGLRLPHDGVAFGDLMVRGPWIVERYFKEQATALVDGWFPTGDVATIDADGYMQITDRSKDVIKSGGEWISSIDLENIAVSHPAVAEAGVIAVPHPKWDERPLLVVVRKPGSDVSREQLLEFFSGKIAKWWLPDDVVFVDQLPHTATGKILKTRLRDDYRNYKLPTA